MFPKFEFDEKPEGVVRFKRDEVLDVPDDVDFLVGGYTVCSREGRDLADKALFVSKNLTPHIVTDSDGETCIIFTRRR